MCPWDLSGPPAVTLTNASSWNVKRYFYQDVLLLAPGPVPFGICKCSLVETTDTQSYITSVYDTFPCFDFYRLWLITEYRFPKGICNGCGVPTGNPYSSGHLVPSLCDLHMFYLLRPILFRTCRYFTGLCSSNIPRYFLDFDGYTMLYRI